MVHAEPQHNYMPRGVILDDCVRQQIERIFTAETSYYRVNFGMPNAIWADITWIENSLGGSHVDSPRTVSRHPRQGLRHWPATAAIFEPAVVCKGNHVRYATNLSERTIMKLTGCETLHCDAGWRVFSFLKLTADNGLVGWSEYNESYGSMGLSGVIERLARRVMGMDPRANEYLSQMLYAATRQAPGGVNAQAIAAIENAVLDLKGKALDVPVHTLLGGAQRDRLELYWSHCGTYRMGQAAQYLDTPKLESADDLVALGAEVRERGFHGLKTNMFYFDDDGARLHMPGFTGTAGWPALNAPRDLIPALRTQLEALRQGAGPDVGIHLDLNFNFKPEGYLQVTRALDDHGLTWFEIDLFDPIALRRIRDNLRTPIASCESLFGLREFRPFFSEYAVDVAIIDVPWNGIWQSMKIATLAEAYEVNVAPHNFYGHLSTIMSAHLCAAIPNFRVMEIDVDDVSWKDDLVTVVPQIEHGYLLVPDGPGWGSDVNEEVVRAHPPKWLDGLRP
jgi:galactonate dehydratase